MPPKKTPTSRNTSDHDATTGPAPTGVFTAAGTEAVQRALEASQSAVRATNPPGDSQGQSTSTPGTVEAQHLVTALSAALAEAFQGRVPTLRQDLPTTSESVAPTDQEDFLARDPPGTFRSNYNRHVNDSDDDNSDSPERPVRHHRRVLHHPPTGTRGQRLFTEHDLPTRRDLQQAFIFVDRASRQSRFFGTRDVVELQLLELFVQVWDSRPGLRPSAKLRVFDRVRLLYHVALSGWSTALSGYADPSASFLLGAPLPPAASPAAPNPTPERPSRPPQRGRPPTTRTRTKPKEKQPKDTD